MFCLKDGVEIFLEVLCKWEFIKNIVLWWYNLFGNVLKIGNFIFINVYICLFLKLDVYFDRERLIGGED